MASVLVAYWSGEGQTEKVAAFVEDVLSERGHDCTVQRIDGEETPAVEAYDAVLVGSPVNSRRHPPAVAAFVEANADALAERPSGFFQLSLAATVPFAWAQGGDREYVDDFVDRTGWHPDRVGSFAGALKYSAYGPIERQLFRVAAAVTTGDTDTSQDYEYTDWNEVEAFAVEFAEYVEDRLAAAEGTQSDTGRRRRTGVAAFGLLLGVAGVAYWAARRGMPEC
ncbi:protoporphyrinogen oxidase [Halobellus sp. Atlit-31R]|nr:protoporphyrinogen oxidase [Halobellus sp. Atlit-31R]